MEQNNILARTSKAWSIKEIIDKLGLIKIKKFCSMEDNLKASQSGNICKRRIW